MGYIPSAADPRSAGGAEASSGGSVWRWLDTCAQDDDASSEQSPDAPDQALARVLGPVIRQVTACWQRRQGNDGPTPGDIAEARGQAAAAAGADPVAASVCGFLDDVLALVDCLRPEEDQASRLWPGDSLFDWTRDIPDGAPAGGIERATGRSDAAWALYACATLHGLERWRREAAAECVAASSHAFVTAARSKRWDVALVHLGRHGAASAAVGDHQTAPAQHFMLHNPNPIPDQIGWELGRAHSRQQELLGTVPLSAAGLAFDIAIALRASYEEEALAFFGGHQAGASPDVLAALEAHDGLDEPSRLGPSPDFEIAAPASYERAAWTGAELALRLAELRNEDTVRRGLRERARQLSGSAPGHAGAARAAALACEALAVAGDVTGQARASFVQTVRALVAEGRWADVVRAVDAGRPYLDALLREPETGAVEGCRLLALSRQAPPDDEPGLMLAGCRALIGSLSAADVSLAGQVLVSRLPDLALSSHLGEAISLLVSQRLRLAKLTWSLEPAAQLRAFLEAVRGDGAGDPALVDIALSGCSVLLAPGSTPEEMAEAIARAGTRPELADLADLLESSAPSPPPEAAAAYGYLGTGISALTHQALLDEDWPTVAVSAQVDLAELPPGDGTAATRVLLTGTIARGLRGMADTTRDPAVVAGAAQETRSLLDARGEQVLRFADRALDSRDRALWLLSAGNLGLAGIALHRRSPDGPVPRLAVRLLERAAELAARDADPLVRADCLHDLGQAHLALAAEQPSDEEALKSLEAAAALLREALVLHRELRRRPGGAVAMRARPAHVDLLNVGQTYLEIARRLFGEDQLPGSGPYAAPLYLRAALWTLSAGRDLARESGDLTAATVAGLQLGDVKTEIAMACLEHTRANKGAFRRDFQLFLAVLEQVPASTWELASRYAMSALRDVTEALSWSVERHDPARVLAALNGAFRILGLAQLRHGVSGGRTLLDDNLSNMTAMRRAALVVLQEALDAASGALPALGLEEVQGEVADWARFLRAQLLLERDARQAGVGELAAAAAEFERLRRCADPILRAFARPYADWFSVSVSEDRVAVNGLAAGPKAGGLEVTLPAQGRSFVIGGLSEPAMTVLLREASWVKRESTSAIASRLPQFDWSSAPAVVPVLAGTGRGGEVKLQIARLPATGWDVWVMHLATAPAAEADLTFPFALRGVFSATDASAEKRDDGPLGPGDVAVMDAPGLAIEVSLDHDAADPLAEVHRSGADTRLRVRGKVRIALRTAPAVIDAGISVLVRSDTAFAAACGAVSSSVVSPALGIPGELMRTHVQLLPYRDTADARLLQRVRDSSGRQVVLVGTPGTDQAAGELLGAIADPRRDVVWIVEERELPRVAEAVTRLEGGISRRCAAPVFAIAGSTDTPFGDSPHVQVIVAPRALAPAAIQLATDLIAFRRMPMEDIPTSPLGFEFELLGDPAEMRRALTQLPNPATLDEVAARHRELCGDLPIRYVSTADPDARDGDDRLAQLWRPLSPRPALVVPEDRGLVLACTPYARHLGALLLADGARTREIIGTLRPPRVLAVEGCTSIPDGTDVEWLPGDPRGIAMRFAARARADHEEGVGALRRSEHAGTVDELLLRRMEPTAYAVVASLSAVESDAAALAANYAATLGSPLLLVDDERVFSAGARARAADVLSGAVRGTGARDARPGVTPVTVLSGVALDTGALAELEAALATLAPVYLAFVSNRMTLPVELAGEPPLATRYAVGRLTAPDVPTLAMLIGAAALREETVQDARASAVIVEAAGAVPDRYLPEAAAEARTVSTLLASAADFAVTDITGADDRDRFLRTASGAAIIHFSGHGRYSDAAPDDAALVFRQGLLRPQDIPPFERAAPVVFGNACESGAAHAGDGLGQAWSGLAAGFINAGALNYLGSLWPVLDEGSRRLAERFYALLVDGHSVGESLRIAKLRAFSERDATWAAVVLFGCPRNRLIAGGAGLR